MTFLFEEDRVFVFKRGIEVIDLTGESNYTLIELEMEECHLDASSIPSSFDPEKSPRYEPSSSPCDKSPNYEPTNKDDGLKETIPQNCGPTAK